jgi:hypothetical protein
MLKALRAIRFPLFGFAVLLLLLAVRLMNFEMRKDEQLYLPPAKLLANQSLYADFFYNHTPVSAWYFYGVLNAMGTDRLLLSGRVAILIGWLLFGLALIAITYRLTRSQTLSTLALASAFANGALLNQTGMAATNNLLVLTAAYAGIGLFLVGVTGRNISVLAILLAGCMLSLAAGIKASAFVFIPIAATASLFLPDGVGLKERLLKVTLPLAVGGVIGAAPVLAYLLQIPDQFLAHVVGFHTGPHVAYWAAKTDATDEIVALTMPAKALLASEIWLSGANIAMLLVVLMLLAAIALFDSVSQLVRHMFGGEIAFVIVCMIAAAVMSFLPTPGFPQYYTLPLVCAPLLVAVLFRKLKEDEREGVRPVAIAAIVISLVTALPQLLQFVPRLARPASWTVVKTHTDGLRLAKAMTDAGVQGKVATLAPVYPLEAGLPVYPEFATGQFVYRTAPFMEPTLKSYFKTTSPDEVDTFFEKDPPAAILTGFEPEMEKPLVAYAVQHGYKKIEPFELVDRYGSADLYVRVPQ